MISPVRTLHLLCAGAAQGLVKALSPQLLARHGATLDARFGAVGAMKEALAAGAPCDVMVVTAGMVDELVQAGALRGDSRAALGRVRTGIAVRTDAPVPDVATAAALKAALLAAPAIYFPDPQRATAGIHFSKVMRELGVHDELAARFRTFPNGATAMRELANAGGPGDIGCTQVSEILYTEGITLVAALPDPFELATTYTAALGRHAHEPELAALFITMLCDDAAHATRQAAGFEPS